SPAVPVAPLTWTELGLNLPQAQVTSIHYTPPSQVDGPGVSDVLVVATRGRGAFRLDQASRYLAALPSLRVDGDAGNNVIALTVDGANPTLIDVVVDGRVV